MNNNIDKLYENMLKNAETTEPENIKLTDDQVEEILSTIENSTDNEVMIDAKQAAESCDLSDEEIKGKVILNPITGKPMSVEEFNEENEKPLQERIDEEVNKRVDDIKQREEEDKYIIKYCIYEFFAVDLSDEAFDNHNITEEVIKELIKITEKFRISLKTGKKFSYYNAMPEPIKMLIQQYQGANALTAVGNMNREARNYISSCFLNAILKTSLEEAVTGDAIQTIAKFNIESEKKVTNVSRDLIEDLRAKIPEYEANGEHKKVEISNAIMESYDEAYTYKKLIEAVKKLKVKRINLEKFDKYCESFNKKYLEGTNEAITDVKQAYLALSRSEYFNEDDEVYKKVIAYFIAYTSMNNMAPNNIAHHIYMYYFIFNIVALGSYDEENERDKAYNYTIVKNLQTLIDIIKAPYEPKTE